jgi:hypothetical protein
MSTAKTVEYIQPPNNLRQKQKLAGVNMTLDPRLIDNAELIIRNSTNEYFESVNQELARLQRRYEEASQDPESRPLQIEEIHALSQSIAGQGTSFGYPLLTGIATQLCHFIEDHVFPVAGTRGVTDPELDVVKVHNEAMRLVVQQKMAGDGGPVGQKLLGGLGLVIKKVTGTVPSA